jgi:hypothetical protein
VKRHLPRESRAVQTTAEFLHEHAEDTPVDTGDGSDRSRSSRVTPEMRAWSTVAV